MTNGEAARAQCFEVQVNDEPPIIAGAADVRGLTAMVTYVSSRSEIELEVGGTVFDSEQGNEHIGWIQRPLRPGDKIVLKVVESSNPAVPADRYRDQPDFVAQAEREYDERLKKKYGE